MSRTPLRILAFLCATLAMAAACGGGETTTPPTPAADEHAGHAHDHEGHDHEAHDHASEDHGEDAHDHGEDAHDHAAHEEHDAHDHGEDAHDHTAHEEHDAHTDDHASLELSELAATNIGVKIQEAESRVWYDQLKIPGTVHVDWDRRATLSTPTTVRIVKLDAPPHATVQAGQRLAVLEMVDPELRALQIRAVETRTALIEARIERDRTAAYLHALETGEQEVSTERRRVTSDLEILEARVTSHSSTLHTILAALETAGLSGSQLEALEDRGEPATHITLYAPRLPGNPELEVTARDWHLGQTVDAGSPLYELAALDQLLVWGEAFEADLDAVRRAARDDLPVSLLFPGEGRTVTGLAIRSLEGTLHGESRTTHFFVALPNPKLSEETVDGVNYVDRETRAGSRVQIMVGTEEMGRRIVLPATAVVTEGGKSLVYIKHSGHYEPIEVRVESVDSRQAVLPEGGGLEAGDKVVVTGALQVHLAFKQSSGTSKEPEGGGAHHGHSH